MKTFISAADIEEMADQGVRELTVDEDTVLTSVARETAGQRGIKLVAPGAAKSAFPESGRGDTGRSDTGRGNPAPTSSGKPRGCQHGPIDVGTGSPRPAAAGPTGSGGGGNSPVVDELIGAVKQMARAPQGR